MCSAVEVGTCSALVGVHTAHAGLLSITLAFLLIPAVIADSRALLCLVDKKVDISELLLE